MLSKKSHINILIIVKLPWQGEANEKYRFNNQYLIKLVKSPSPLSIMKEVQLTPHGPETS